MYEHGDILYFNTLWKLGAHYHYEFFFVTHVTPKGNVMGHYMHSTCDPKEHGVGYRTEEWRVCQPPQLKDERAPARRLPKPNMWSKLSDEQLSNGIRVTNCVD